MKCLEIIERTLKTVSENVGHYEALKKEDRYIVWAEDGGARCLAGDNMLQNQAVQGTIDYFTRQEDDPLADDIQCALKNAKVSFYLDSVQYEDDTGYIHYQWIFEVS